jgi:hypothetical protein
VRGRAGQEFGGGDQGPGLGPELLGAAGWVAGGRLREFVLDFSGDLVAGVGQDAESALLSHERRIVGGGTGGQGGAVGDEGVGGELADAGVELLVGHGEVVGGPQRR